MSRTVTSKPVINGTVVATADREQAQALTDKIRAGQEDALRLYELIAEAFGKRVWEPMGYQTWAAYCEAEFKVMSLGRDHQAAINAMLQLEAGMSARAAAAATGTDHKTAKKDADRATGERSPVNPGSSQKARKALEKRVKELAKSQNMWAGLLNGTTKQAGGVKHQTYQLIRFGNGDGRVLRRITLEEAERYLTDGTIPAGAEIPDRGDIYAWSRVAGTVGKATGESSPVGSGEPQEAPPERRVGADGKSRPATRTRPEKGSGSGSEKLPLKEKSLALGWQRTADALGLLMQEGAPKLRTNTRAKVIAALRQAAEFLEQG